MKKSVLARKYGLKLLSLLLAFCLWVYVLNASRVRFEKTVSVVYLLPDHLVFTKQPVKEVTFQMEAPRAFARIFQDRDEKIEVDLRQGVTAQKLQGIHHFSASELDLPLGIQVLKLYPTKVELKLEKKASKVLPIKIVFSNSELDLKILQQKVIPETVEISGPRDIISGLKEILTRPIDVEQLEEAGLIPLELQLNDERLIVLTKEVPILQYKLKVP